MKQPWIVATALAALLAGAPLAAQHSDYLTPEEVELAREAQEPNKRVVLFIGFAADRLQKFEAALKPAAGQAPARPPELKELLNDFTRAVDDTADKLEEALKRGGVDLHKTQPLVRGQSEHFLDRLKQLAQADAVRQDENLRYTLEDAEEAVEALQELGGKIPKEAIPAAAPEPEEAAPANPAGGGTPPPPGQPSLKRRQQKQKEKEKKPSSPGSQ